MRRGCHYVAVLVAFTDKNFKKFCVTRIAGTTENKANVPITSENAEKRSFTVPN